MLREEQVWSPSHGTHAPCTAPGFCCQLKLKHLQSCLIPHCFSLRVARASFLIQAEMSYEAWRKAPECALMDEAVAVNMCGGIVTVQHPLQEGQWWWWWWLLAPFRQMAGKFPVSPERDMRPPGSLCVGASSIWSVALQGVQSDSWHLLDQEEVCTAATFSALLSDEQPLLLLLSYAKTSHNWFPLEHLLLLMRATQQHYNQNTSRSKTDSNVHTHSVRLVGVTCVTAGTTTTNRYSNAAQNYCPCNLSGHL